MTINKDLFIAKYNMHLNEASSSRNSVFFTVQLLVVIWGAHLTLLITKTDFLKNNPMFFDFVEWSVYLIFGYISLFLSRLIRIEKIHWAIIRLFEKDFPAKYKFDSYLDEAPIRNKNILLMLAAFFPIFSLLIADSIINLAWFNFDNITHILNVLALAVLSIWNICYAISSARFKPKLDKKTH
jgi:hypothetical protein